jgi:predicted dehydrogenase
MTLLRIAIVGCGWVAGTQMTTGFALLPDLFEVAVACDSDVARATTFAAEHHIGRVMADYDAVLADPAIDAVSLCTPPSLHHPMAIAALKAGKHVICEKPLTSSLALVDDIIATEQASNARLMPIFQYRFEAGVQRIKRVLDAGIAGKAYVASVETAWKRGPAYYEVPWRGKFATELGGVLLTQAIHIHDLLMFLRGPAAEVKAFKTTRVNAIEVEDCAVAALRMADGSLCSLTATLGSQRPLTRLRLCFEKLTIERQSVDADAPRPGTEPWIIIPRDEAVGEQVAAIAAPDTALAGFAAQFAGFHAALATGDDFPVTLQDARRSLELITALFHASETGESVTLPVGRDHARYRGWISAQSPARRD